LVIGALVQPLSLTLLEYADRMHPRGPTAVLRPGEQMKVEGAQEIGLASTGVSLCWAALKNSKPMPGGSGLRVRLVGMVLLAIAAVVACFYFTGPTRIGIALGLLALAGAWLGGERLVLRRLRPLVHAARRFGAGDLTGRTGLADESGELGQLARALEDMAAALAKRLQAPEHSEQPLLNRALQQTAVAALGQFALTSSDFSALLNQAALLISQTLEVEFCRVLELMPGRQTLLLRAGVGWKKEMVGLAVVGTDRGSPAGYTLHSGEPVVIADLRTETRFQSEPFLVEHGVVSGVSVAIGSREKTYGVLGVYTARPRQFTSDDLQFLLAVANALAVAEERRAAEAELKQLAGFAQLNPNPAMELAADATITYFNDAALKLAESVGRRHPSELLPADVEKVVQSCLATGQGRVQLESQMAGRTLSWSLHPVAGNQAMHCYVTDITERLSLEAQMRQSQKMESFSELAAGMANDFNNMLTVIQGHAGMLLARKTLPAELRDSAQAVGFAAERAAALTRQLLLFSRRSAMQFQPLDLRDVVGNMIKVLKRLLGDMIILEYDPAAEIPPVYGDPGMIEQVVMNLAGNARDAMPVGGKLRLGLRPFTVDAAYVQSHPESRPGAFVALSVTDTGCGMNAATLSRIFEPFFTTKQAGKAAGLGLSTVYGIVKQHEGWIDVASTVDKGSTFSVFLPVVGKTAAADPGGEAVPVPVRGGNETVLFVEDDPWALKMGCILLQDCGYRVLEAASGSDALQVWRRESGSIDLLLTDMVMPEGLSGIELAQKLRAAKPGLKILLTSGYNLADLDTEFIRESGCAFLQKPYTRLTLTQGVRESLDNPQPNAAVTGRAAPGRDSGASTGSAAAGSRSAA
jgi:signal transduction histidine kinase/ActR/RegA family two-component response regulator/HAMP domain-containing protein